MNESGLRTLVESLETVKGEQAARIQALEKVIAHVHAELKIAIEQLINELISAVYEEADDLENCNRVIREEIAPAKSALLIKFAEMEKLIEDIARLAIDFYVHRDYVVRDKKTTAEFEVAKSALLAKFKALSEEIDSLKRAYAEMNIDDRTKFQEQAARIAQIKTLQRIIDSLNDLERRNQNGARS
jgi:hypothetical protein